MKIILFASTISLTLVIACGQQNPTIQIKAGAPIEIGKETSILI